MLDDVFAPMCIGSCPYGGGGQSTSAILHDQQNAFSLIEREISKRRITSLTPAKMRSELSDLSARIDQARFSLRRPLW